MALQPVNILETYLLPKLVKSVLAGTKRLSKLWPIQTLAIEAGLFQGTNLVVVSPTGAGKTLVGELAAINHSQSMKKTLWLVPYKALAEQKADQMRHDYRNWLEVTLSTGDVSPSPAELEASAIIVVVYEKLDYLIRRKPAWLTKIGLLVVDEIQMLGDDTRGPRLEFVITSLRKMASPQILGLSATLGEESRRDLCNWLQAKAVVSDWRPVPLDLGMYSCKNQEIVYKSGTKELLKLPSSVSRLPEKAVFSREILLAASLEALAKHFTSQKRKLIVFSPTRQASERAAETIYTLFQKEPKLMTLASELADLSIFPARMARTLEKTVAQSVAFHHAGLPFEARKAIEEAFVGGELNVICATTTLAAGVNFPADVVIIEDFRREKLPEEDPIDVVEYLNMSGRAGRPGYTKAGASIVIAADQMEEAYVEQNYFGGEPSPILPQLLYSDFLTDAIMAWILVLGAGTEDALLEVLQNTASFRLRADLEGARKTIQEILQQLCSEEASLLAKDGQVYQLTPLGRAIAENGLSPHSARALLAGLNSLKDKGYSDFAVLYTICATRDFEDATYVILGNRDKRMILENITSLSVPGLETPRTEPEFRALKAAIVLYAWIAEQPLDRLIEALYHTDMGDIERWREAASWVADRLILLLNDLGLAEPLIADILNLKMRLLQGIKPDLLPLFQNRIRTLRREEARKLHEDGIKTQGDVIKLTATELATNHMGIGRARQFLYELADRMPLSFTDKQYLRHLAVASKEGIDENLVRNLYRSCDKHFELAVETALRNILPRKYLAQRISEQPTGEVDILISLEGRPILTIECYAPEQAVTASLEKMLSASKGACLHPDILCFCSNAPTLPSKDNCAKVAGAGIAYLDVTGLVELLIVRKRESITGEELFDLLRDKKEPVTSGKVYRFLQREESERGVEFRP